MAAKELTVIYNGNTYCENLTVGKFSWTEHPNGAVELKAEPVREPGDPAPAGGGLAGLLEQFTSAGRNRAAATPVPSNGAAHDEPVRSA